MHKKIQPSKAYVNGKQMIAESITVESAKDTLFGSVVFRCTLWTAEGIWAGEAALNCKYDTASVSAFKGLSEDGQTVLCDWDASPEGAYEIVAAGMGLEFEPSVGSKFFEV